MDHDPNNGNDMQSSDSDEALHFAPCVLAGLPVDSKHPSSTPHRPLNLLSQQSVHVRQAAAHLIRFRLHWPSSAWPRVFLILHKDHDEAPGMLPILVELIRWLLCDSPAGLGTKVYVTPSLLESEVLQEVEGKGRVSTWRKGNKEEEEGIDLIITVGGDGTVLGAAWQFQQIVPPIVPFHHGTVGFLNAFALDAPSPGATLDRLIRQGCRVAIRMRLACQHQRVEGEARTYHVMNEVVLDRGAGQHMVMLDVWMEGHFLTTVQADGLIVATPTGSTAYSMSAGGSMAHPAVPALLMTPVCPQSLSFRPLILPDSVEIVIRISPSSRGTVWV